MRDVSLRKKPMVEYIFDTTDIFGGRGVKGIDGRRAAQCRAAAKQR
jgi:hypothetical protein